MNRMARSISAAISSYRAYAGLAVKPRFHSCTRSRDAKPPVVNARIRFSVDADVWYASSSRSGSGVRASAVNSKPLMMSPRNAGSVTPSRVSESDDRGLAYCPAIRPILMTGRLAP
jgi:hypothetical protein